MAAVAIVLGLFVLCGAIGLSIGSMRKWFSGRSHKLPEWLEKKRLERNERGLPERQPVEFSNSAIGRAMLGGLIITIVSLVISVLQDSAGFLGVMADVLAPTFWVAFALLGALLHRLLSEWEARVGESEAVGDELRKAAGAPPVGQWSLGARFSLAGLAARLATLLALVGLALSWAQEWFEWPGARWILFAGAVMGVALAVAAYPIRFEVLKESERWYTGLGPVKGIHRWFIDGPPDQEGPPDQQDRLRRFRLRAVAFAAITLIAGLTVLSQLDGLLKGMTTDERPSAGIASLSDVFDLDFGLKDEKATEIVRGWREHGELLGERSGAKFASARLVVWLHTAVDISMVVTGYGFLIGIALLMARRRLGRSRDPDEAARTDRRDLLLEMEVDKATDEDVRYVLEQKQLEPKTGPALDAVRRFALASEQRTGRSFRMVALVGLLGLLVAAAADIFENGLQVWAFELAWRASEGSVPNLLVLLLWLASLLKWVGLAAVAFAGILLSLRRLRERAHERRQEGLEVRLSQIEPYRAQLLLLAIFAVALLYPAQMADVIRRWKVHHVLLNLVMAGALALMITRFRPWVNRGRVDEEGKAKPPNRRLRLGVVGGILSAAAVQAGGEFLLRDDWGAGLLVPAGIVAVLWILGLPFHSRHQDLATPRGLPLRTGAPDVHRALGASVFVILGITVMRSAVGDLVYARRFDWWLVLLALIPVSIWLRRKGPPQSSRDARWELSLAAGGLVYLIFYLFNLPADPPLSSPALLVIGVAMVYSAVTVFDLLDRETAKSTAAFLLGAVPGSLESRFKRRHYSVADSVGGRWRASLLVLAGALVAWVTIRLIVEPVVVAPWFGTVAVIGLFFAYLTAVVLAAVRFAEATEPPLILGAIGMRRTPVLLFFLVWFVISVSVDAGEFHDVPVATQAELRLDSGPPEPPLDASVPEYKPVYNISIADAFERWKDKNPEVKTLQGGDDRRAVPFVIVSSSGGGIRAATWTAYVMDCVFNASRTVMTSSDDTDSSETGACLSRVESFAISDRLAAVSGVSGGALGFAAYAARLTEKALYPDVSGGSGWVNERLGADYLAAPASRLLFVDLPRGFIGFTSAVADRGEVLEWAWEDSWRFTDDQGESQSWLRQGLFNLWYGDPHVPLMVFNGTSVKDGCRFNGSVLDINVPRRSGDCVTLAPFEAGSTAELKQSRFAATLDLADFLCNRGEDIRLSTAALLSARFPLISPTGRFDRSVCGDEDESTTFIVDGGYLESTGALTALDLWEAFEPLVREHNDEAGAACIVPFMIHIDNGYDTPASADPEGRPAEYLAPIQAASATRSGLSANARAAAALAFEQPLRSPAGTELRVVAGTEEGDRQIRSRYARITTRAHPGVQAPLGWTLSKVSMEDLRNQLDTSENLEELMEIRWWFSEDLRCSVASPEPLPAEATGSQPPYR